MATARVRRFWARAATLACLLCQRPAVIAHCHGPSLRERNPQFLKPKGKKPAWGDWLIAPLCPDHHNEFDASPAAFAVRYGLTAAEMVDEVGRVLRVDPWAEAEALLKPLPNRDRQDFRKATT